MPPYFKHESAIVDDGAVVGDDTKVWHFTHVAGGARVGKSCVLGQNVYLAPTVVLGDNVRVQNNVSIYDGVIVEDHVFIGPSAVFTNVNNPRSEVPRKDAYLTTHLRRGATIGANSTIICGHELGDYCFIGAGSVLTADVPAFALVVGVPGRQIGWVCRCGERLDLSGSAAWCAACGRGYTSDGTALREAG